jgi:signal transduction histidine kinase
LIVPGVGDAAGRMSLARGTAPSLTKGTRGQPASGENGPVGMDVGSMAAADRLRRLVVDPHARMVVSTVLGGAALAEAFGRAVATDAGTQVAVVFFLLAVATTTPLALFGPVGNALAAPAAGVLSILFFHTLTVGGVGGQVIALYRAGREGEQVLAAALAMPYLVLAFTGTIGSEAWVLTVVLASLAPVGAWAGIAGRAREEATRLGEARQAIAGTLLEHTARGERARISRELHDVVAHHISMIAVQAENTRLTIPGMPAAGAQRLSAIGDTARSALTEMRRLLGVLREDADVGPAELRPQPGLPQLNELLDAAREASGAGIRLILRGPPAPLDPGVELAAYRIVQEALTNARRHAPGCAVDVELHYTDETLRVRVRDNGPGLRKAPADGSPAAGDGHGLLGMRERAAAVGGELRVGTAAGGGFVVEAVLPAKADDAG